MIYDPAELRVRALEMALEKAALGEDPAVTLEIAEKYYQFMTKKERSNGQEGPRPALPRA